MIYVVATIELKPGTRSTYLDVFRGVMPKVQAEDGCIAYEPTIDVSAGLPIQPPLRKDTVVIMERWASIEHLQAHLQTQHMADYREKVKDMVVGVTVHVLEPARA